MIAAQLAGVWLWLVWVNWSKGARPLLILACFQIFLHTTWCACAHFLAWMRFLDRSDLIVSTWVPCYDSSTYHIYLFVYLCIFVYVYVYVDDIDIWWHILVICKYCIMCLSVYTDLKLVFDTKLLTVSVAFCKVCPTCCTIWFRLTLSKISAGPTDRPRKITE